MNFSKSTGNHRLLIMVALGAFLAVFFPGSWTAAQEDPVDIKTFVTRDYLHGIPYEEARAYGREAVPELITMLRDPEFEEHWVKIIFTLGCIGDPAAVKPLKEFLRNLEGEISVHSFRAALSVPPTLGQIAYGGDEESLSTLIAFTRPDPRDLGKLNFAYGRYRGEALDEVLGRMALQGLGLSGSGEALGILAGMRADKSLRADWRDNVDEAIGLNNRVSQEGLARAFEEVER